MGERRRKSKASKRQNAKAETLDLLLKNWEFCVNENSRLQTNSMRVPSLGSKPSVGKPRGSLAEC